MTRAEVESCKRIIAHLRKEAAHIERSPWKLAKGRAATRRRWADLLVKIVATREKSCKGCYYEGEEVNRCMCCSRLKWRKDNWTTKEAK